MDIALSLVSLTVLALVLGAAFLFRRGGATKQAWLMLLLALIMAINVAIWTLPTENGASLVDSVPNEKAPE